MENGNLILTILQQIGGAGIIIGGLAAWLGKVWATRIADAQRAAHEQELAHLKSSLEIEKARVENTLSRLTETQKQLLQTSLKIDLDLRKRRLDVYQEIWQKTEILPKWPRAESVTYDNLHKFSESLRQWYFNKGGIFLSRSTHSNAYIPL